MEWANLQTPTRTPVSALSDLGIHNANDGSCINVNDDTGNDLGAVVETAGKLVIHN